MKIGVVDAGGCMRGFFAAGMLDYCMDHSIRFDLGLAYLPEAPIWLPMRQGNEAGIINFTPGTPSAGST